MGWVGAGVGPEGPLRPLVQLLVSRGDVIPRTGFRSGGGSGSIDGCVFLLSFGWVGGVEPDGAACRGTTGPRPQR